MRVNETYEACFNRNTGKLVGGGKWDQNCLYEVTPAFQERILRAKMIARLQGVKWAEQSDEVLSGAWFVVREGAEKKEEEKTNNGA